MLYCQYNVIISIIFWQNWKKNPQDKWLLYFSVKISSLGLQISSLRLIHLSLSQREYQLLTDYYLSIYNCPYFEAAASPTVILPPRANMWSISRKGTHKINLINFVEISQLQTFCREWLRSPLQLHWLIDSADCFLSEFLTGVSPVSLSSANHYVKIFRLLFSSSWPATQNMEFIYKMRCKVISGVKRFCF